MDDTTTPTREAPVLQDYECRVYHLETYVAHKTVRARTPKEALRKLMAMEAEGELDFMDYCDGEPSCEFVVETRKGDIIHVVQEHSLYAQQKRNRILLDVLNDKELDRAHDALSDLLEAPDAGNDDIRDAAITLCAALCDFAEKRRKAITQATEAAL